MKPKACHLTSILHQNYCCLFDITWACHFDIEILLTLKGPRPFFGPFLKFGQAIVDAIFVQKISNFQ
jgi:hypothetical protein